MFLSSAFVNLGKLLVALPSPYAPKPIALGLVNGNAATAIGFENAVKAAPIPAPCPANP